MPTIREILRDKVSLDIRSVDRVLLNGWVKNLHMPGGVVTFIREQRGWKIHSPLMLNNLTVAFRLAVEQFATANGLEIVDTRRLAPYSTGTQPLPSRPTSDPRQRTSAITAACLTNWGAISTQSCRRSRSTESHIQSARSDEISDAFDNLIRGGHRLKRFFDPGFPSPDHV